MVRRCCVPKCTSASSMPVHRFPKNKEKAEAWLKAIDRNDLIDLPQEKQNELKICTEHFTEEMFIKDRSRRCLKEDAHPISNINLFNTNINNDNITDIHFSNTTENSTNNVIMVAGSHQDNIKIIKKEEEINNLKLKLKRQKKRVYKNRIIIKKYRHKLKERKRKNKWEQVVTNLSGTQKIFMDMMLNNLNVGLQVCFFTFYLR
ncbi:hypothetical protein PUN28_003662 [Cardiocondyla obscurior]|uniref:THAP-type domain-containing protein n=1 Tax=Cardiocondyla obscurior TaxID=286306 RepID=A0AAW2GLR3_9HYME